MIPILEVQDLSVHYPITGHGAIARMLRRPRVSLRAVDGVTLAIGEGEALGIVGESGCGKSTLARALVGLQRRTAGTLLHRGEPLSISRTRGQRRAIQMVFQDPASSLNPRRTVAATLSELLRVHHLASGSGVSARCRELIDLVELPASVLDRRPSDLSGGQRQRVGIARALAVEPEVLIADEAVAALDVSVQAAVLGLLQRLREELGLTLIFISHDLAAVRSVCDRVAVMYLGRVVAESDTETLFEAPRHPYAEALLAAVPRPEARRRSGESVLAGEPPSPLAIPSGCRFHPRCPLVEDRCRTEEPVLFGLAHDRVACHVRRFRHDTDPRNP